MAVTRPTTEHAPTFAELGVPAALAKALAAQGITTAFPIQAATLPDSLAGRDVLGRGRTGSGKTYAFVLPLLARLAALPKAAARRPHALVLAPTRELATQIHTAMAPLAAALSLRTATVFGGVSASPQIRALRAGVDVLVACPGRLADHLSTGAVHLDAIEVVVLDEADHMADLGFLPVVRKLLDRTPANGQRLLFSATLDAGVNVLVRRYLDNPVTHSVDSAQSPVAAMTHHVLHVRQQDRFPVLVDLAAAPGRTLVFTRTKRGATRLTRQLVQSGVAAVELHGNLAQNARTRNLTAFADGGVSTLVATDIAARGIHVDDVALVIHADPPVEHKAYLHRSGRTARAGAGGTVVTLMTDEQVPDVRDLTRKAGIQPVTTRIRAGHPLLAQIAPGARATTVLPVAVERDRPASGRRQNGSGKRQAGAAKQAGSGRRQDGSARRQEPAGGRATSAKRQEPAGSRRTSSAKRPTTGAKQKKEAVVARPAASIASFSAGSRAGRRGR